MLEYDDDLVEERTLDSETSNSNDSVTFGQCFKCPEVSKMYFFRFLSSLFVAMLDYDNKTC